MIHQSCSSGGQGSFSTLEELLCVFKSLLCEYVHDWLEGRLLVYVLVYVCVH